MSTYLSDSQKDLLQKLMMLKEKGDVNYPFYLANGINGLPVVLGSENVEFEMGDIYGLVEADLLRVHYSQKGQKSYSISNLGTYAVKNDFKIPQPTATNQYIGTWIQGDVSSSNILSVGLANAQISQVINDPTLLKGEVETVIEKLLEEVKSELKGDDLIEYIKAADELKQYLLTDISPSPSALKKAISTLSFLGSIDGTTNLMVKAWPYIYPLIALATAIGNIQK
jgi:hypothetical protein